MLCDRQYFSVGKVVSFIARSCCSSPAIMSLLTKRLDKLARSCIKPQFIKQCNRFIHISVSFCITTSTMAYTWLAPPRPLQFLGNTSVKERYHRTGFNRGLANRKEITIKFSPRVKYDVIRSTQAYLQLCSYTCET